MIFTKPPIPGRVKTRLIGELTAEQAAELHGAFLADLLDALAAGTFALRIAWAVDDAEPLPAGAVPGFRQTAGDLGARLFSGLAKVAREHRAVAAIGSDHPGLGRSTVERAFALLEGDAEVVLGPAADGGYYLIGVRSDRLDPGLFRKIAWSGPEVLAATRRRCRHLGLAVAELPAAADVDTPADLRAFVARLATGAVDAAASRRLLARWGLMPRPVEAPCGS